MSQRRNVFSISVVIGLICLGVFSFAGFMVLSAFAPEMSAGSAGGAHALSRSAEGFAAIVRLLRETGQSVTVGRTIGDPTRRADLVVLTPTSGVTWEDLDKAGGRSTLVIMPKWIATPDPLHRGWSARVGAFETQGIAQALTPIMAKLTVSRRSGAAPVEVHFPDHDRTSGAIEQLQTLASPDLQPIVVDAAGNTLAGRLMRSGRATNVFVLTDPDFLNTQGLSNINTAQVGVDIIDLTRVSKRRPIVFDVTLNGLGSSRSVLRLAFTPPLLGFTLGLALAAALLAWRATARFGFAAPDQRALAFGKTALADNAAALLRLGRREKTIAQGYASMMLAQSARDLGVWRPDESATIAALDRVGVTKRVSTSASSLLSEFAAVKSPSSLLASARKLHAWKKEITRAAR